MGRKAAMLAPLLLAGALHWYESPAVIIDPFTPFGSSGPTLYLSLASSGTLTGLGAGGADVVYTDEDILSWNGSYFSLYFDGSAAGLPDTDIAAFDIDSANNRILMAFLATITIPAAVMDTGIQLTVSGADIVAYSQATGKFTWIFDGSDVGLTSSPGEFVDALQLLPNGDIVVSLQGDGVVNLDYPDNAGTITFLDEDMGVFTPDTPNSPVTTGSWAVYFDGSDVGLTNTAGSTEDIDGVVVQSGGDIYLSTLSTFGVPDTPTVSGTGEDIFVCRGATTGATTACTSWELYFDGSTHGLSADDVDAIDLL